MKFNFVTPFCKVCFKDIHADNIPSLLGEDTHLCQSCFSKMHPKMMFYKLDGIPVISCYLYNEKIREMLYQFKGCFDIELGEVFLVNQKRYLRFLFHSYYLVPAPSYKEKDEARGFNHVEELFKGIGKGYIHAIIKKDDIKQANLHFRKRQEIATHLLWNEKESVSGKNILFVDDLITTGATAKACTKLLLEHGAKKVKILSLARVKEFSNEKG